MIPHVGAQVKGDLNNAPAQLLFKDDPKRNNTLMHAQWLPLDSCGILLFMLPM